MKNLLNTKLNKKGFTLVELLIAMAIIAVLIAIAAYGIQILQRNARNTRRRKIMQDIQLKIADIEGNYFEKPDAITSSGDQVEFSVDGNNLPPSENYEINGFSDISITTADNACQGYGTPPGADDRREENQNTVVGFYDIPNNMVCVKLEGTVVGFGVSV